MAYAIIDSAALSHNFNYLSSFGQPAKLVAMLKSNAYGHGLLICAKALAEQAACFAVATLDEALALRQAGYRQRILILAGFTKQEDLLLMSTYDLEGTLYEPYQIQLIKAWQGDKRIKIWVQINTGMNRLGLLPEVFAELYQALKALPNVLVATLMTHLACSELQSHPLNARQLQVFAKLTAGLPEDKSILNSAGLWHFPGAKYDWIRTGITLYGISPIPEITGADLGLRPVMTLKAPIISLYSINAGETIGYDARWQATRPTRLAVIHLGYGQGYPWHEANLPVWINGQIATTVGRVSMEYITLDVTDVTNVHIGDAVTLFGAELPVETIAAKLKFSPYALVTQLHERLARIQKVT